MKRIICLMLAILMLLSSVSCGDTTQDPVDSNDASVSDSAEAGDIVDTTEKVNTNVIPAEKYNGVFKAGYARTVITPELPAPIGDNIMTSVLDDIYATCIAVNDGENTALIYTVDVKNIGPKVYATIKLRVSIMTKVPKENIIISATHNHSSFTPIDDISKSNSESLTKWTSELPLVMANIAKEAISDMAEAEIYVGTQRTPNMAFIRRWVHEDGSYSAGWTIDELVSPSKILNDVGDPDDSLQIIRLVRKEKKDIIMTNWQAHVAHAIAMMPTQVTSDLVSYVRRGVEQGDDDALVAYFQGASGNLNLTAPTEQLQKYKNYQIVGIELSKKVLEGMKLENLKKIEPGEIKASGMTFKAEIRRDSEETIAHAKEVMALETGSAAQKNLMVKYGFENLYGPRTILAYNFTSVSTYDLALSTISFGDLAFIGAPYEMFDDNGMQIKEGSPFKMTFVLTCAGGFWGYIPSEIYCTKYGGYEVDATQFKHGTAEKLVAEFLRMLKEHKEE